MQHKQGIDRSDRGRGGQVHSVFENFHGNFRMVKFINLFYISLQFFVKFEIKYKKKKQFYLFILDD